MDSNNQPVRVRVHFGDPTPGEQAGMCCLYAFIGFLFIPGAIAVFVNDFLGIETGIWDYIR